MATPKDKLTELINQLNDNQISEVIDFTEFIKNKAQKDFWNNLPEDEEHLTEDDLRAIKEGKEDFKAGKTLKHNEVFGNND